MHFDYDILWRNVRYLFAAAVVMPFALGVFARIVFYRPDDDSTTRQKPKEPVPGPEPESERMSWPGRLSGVEILTPKTVQSDTDHTDDLDAGNPATTT
jgi:hypothetical protein